MRSAMTERPNTRSDSSSRQRESFIHMLERQREGGVAGLSAYSMNGTTASLESDNPNNYRDSSASHSRSHAHHTHSQSYSGGPAILRGSRDSFGGAHQHKRHSLQSPPTQTPITSTRPVLDSFSSRESSHSGRGLGSYTHQSHLRDSMSQDTVGERDFDYKYRYNVNNSSTLPTLSLQDSYHRDHLRGTERSCRGRGRTRLSDDFDLRRNVQEFDVMPIHEVFSHAAMVSPSAGSVPTHFSPGSQNPVSPEGSSGGTVIDQQPLASTVESQRIQSPPDNVHERPSGNVQPPLPHTFYPVFFSPESGRLFMNVDGSYKPLPHESCDHGPNMQPGENLNQVKKGHQTHYFLIISYYFAWTNERNMRISIASSSMRKIAIRAPPTTGIHFSLVTSSQSNNYTSPSLCAYKQAESSGRQTSSSYGMSAPYDYYHCSIVMMLLYILCLNLVAVLLFSIPALWFAKKVYYACIHIEHKNKEI